MTMTRQRRFGQDWHSASPFLTASCTPKAGIVVPTHCLIVECPAGKLVGLPPAATTACLRGWRRGTAREKGRMSAASRPILFLLTPGYSDEP